tara:strand:- start:232 stop:513 length:282 start_codon:yes stop_codon:yes gene_type:complete
MKYAIINSGVVDNIVEWDGTSDYNVEGVLVEADANAYIGGVYADGAFVARPPEPELEKTKEQIQAEADKASAVSKLEALGLTDAEIKALSGGM